MSAALARPRAVVAASSGDAEAIQQWLADAGVDVVSTVASSDDALRAALQQRPDLLVARDGIAGASPVELAELVWARAPAIGSVVVSDGAATDLERRALRAGALAVIASAADAATARDALAEALAALERRRAVLAKAQPRGPVTTPERLGSAVVVVSAKGGVGRSFVAVNLASTLAERAEVALCDLDLQFGDLSTWGRQAAPERSIDQLAAVVNAGELQLEDIRTVAEQRFGKVTFLAGPRSPLEGVSWAAERGARSVRLVQALRSWYAWVIVDGLPGLLEPMVRLARGAGILVVVTGADIGALRSTRRYLEVLDRFAPTPRVVVVDRADRGEPRALVEDALANETLHFVNEDRTFARRLLVEGLAAPQQRGRGTSRALAALATLVETRLAGGR